MLSLFSQTMCVSFGRWTLHFIYYIWWKLHHLSVTKIRDWILLLCDSKSLISRVGKNMHKAESLCFTVGRCVCHQNLQREQRWRQHVLGVPLWYIFHRWISQDSESPFSNLFMSWKTSKYLCNRNSIVGVFFFPWSSLYNTSVSRDLYWTVWPLYCLLIPKPF